MESEKSVDIQKSEKVFYLPYKPVIRESAESSTKLRIIYDASAEISKNGASLNERRETGPPLLNSLHEILRSQMKPIILCRDIQRIFWQIRIKEFGRNSFRFPSISNVLISTRMFSVNNDSFGK